MATKRSQPAGRKPRTDAQRNRERGECGNESGLATKRQEIGGHPRHWRAARSLLSFQVVYSACTAPGRARALLKNQTIGMQAKQASAM